MKALINYKNNDFKKTNSKVNLFGKEFIKNILIYNTNLKIKHIIYQRLYLKSKKFKLQ